MPITNWAIVKSGSHDPQIVKTIVETNGPPPHVEEPGYNPIPAAQLKPGYVMEVEPVPPATPGEVELDALQDEVTILTTRVGSLETRVSALEQAGSPTAERGEPK